MGFIILGLMFYIDNAEFLDVRMSQLKDGHTWHYVGKTKPSGVPAILSEDADGNKVIYYKLRK